MSKFPSLKNHFLIAMPSLSDPNFHQAVTYIIEHNEEGAMGMIINQPMDIDLSELFEHLDIQTSNEFIGNKKIILGGPVQTDRGFIVHSPVGNWESSMIINDDIAVTTSQDILTAMSQKKGPKHVEVILGYAGWGAGQLDEEILENSWLSVPASPEILFHTAFNKRWNAATNLIGFDIHQLSSEIGHC